MCGKARRSGDRLAFNPKDGRRKPAGQGRAARLDGEGDNKDIRPAGGNSRGRPGTNGKFVSSY
jgi:hypothetical protein